MLTDSLDICKHLGSVVLSKHQWMTENMERAWELFKCLYFLQFCNLCSGAKITHLSFKRWLVDRFHLKLYNKQKI